MQKNYIILAHNKPNQLSRLIERLGDGQSYFYIHIDKKSDLDSFSNLFQTPSVKFLTNRVNVMWGEFSIVEAILLLIKAVMADQRQGYTILLSGSDYPIKNNTYINWYLNEHQIYDFINLAPVEEVWPPGTWQPRIHLYHLNYNNDRTYQVYSSFFGSSCAHKKYMITKVLQKDLSPVNFFRFLKKPQLVLKKQPITNHYGGDCWWAFTYKTLKEIYNFITENRKDLFKYYRYTNCSDELFFQTIMAFLQSQGRKFQIKPTLTHTNWTKPGLLPASPVTFTIDDIEELGQAPGLFARKFDMDYDSAILDEIDKTLLQ